MKIGYYQTNENFVQRQDQDALSSDVLSVEDPIDLDDDGVLELSITMENEDFRSQQMFQQMELLQDSLDVIRNTKEVTPAQVKAVAIQLKMCAPYLPEDDKKVMESVIGQVSDDREKNAVITTESIGLALRAIIPLIGAFALVVRAIQLFMSKSRVDEQIRKRADSVKKNVELVSTSQPPDQNPYREAVEINGAAVTDKVNRLLNHLYIVEDFTLSPTNLNNAFKIYDNGVKICQVSSDLCKDLIQSIGSLVPIVSSGNDDERAMDLIGAMEQKVKEHNLKFLTLCHKLSRSTVSEFTDDSVGHERNEHINPTESSEYFQFSLFPEVSRGSLVKSVDGGTKLSKVPAGSYIRGDVTINLTNANIRGALNLMSSATNSTSSAQRLTSNRNELANKLDAFSKRLAGFDSSKSSAPLKKLMGVITSAKNSVTIMDHAWATSCTDIAAVMSAISYIQTASNKRQGDSADPEKKSKD